MKIQPARTVLSLTYVALVVLAASLSPELAAGQKADRCAARLHDLTGDYLDCLLDAESRAIRKKDADKLRARCEKRYNKSFNRAVRRGQADCFSEEADAATVKPLMDNEVKDTVSELSSLITGNPPPSQPATLTIYNGCATSLKIMSPTGSTIDGIVLAPSESKSWATGSSGVLHQNTPNTFMVAPVTSDAQCSQIACQNWSDIQASGQRMGYMWGNDPPHQDNLTYAAYCQPTNAAAKQCTASSTTPCCGSSMVYDKTYGTTFEITPNGGNSLNQDFVDLSTNYGTGPESPPPLCPPGQPGDTCVSASANIFFNVPVKVQMTPPGNPVPSCAFPPGNTNTLSCTAVSCSDAYQSPTDNKQAACPSGTGYVVTFCPTGHPLPSIPATTSPANPDKTITVRNNLAASSPSCPGGNTVTVFRGDGGQQLIPAGGGSTTLSGSYSAYPGLGLQVNNWYWTSERLPVGTSPQNPDNSGAQFVVSDQCTLTQSPPVYGKGIETYKIAQVTSRQTTTGCEIEIGPKPPYTDAVTPNCCAPPLPGFAHVCPPDSWGQTNNHQPWPPQ